LFKITENFSILIVCYDQGIDKERIFIAKLPFSLPNPMFDYLLE